MSGLIAAPLIGAGAVAAACALAAMAHPLAGAALGAVVFVVASPLAIASADRSRRLLWSAILLCAGASAVRTVVAPPSMDPAADPSVAALRAALDGPIRSLVPEPEAGIVLGIVLGERASITRDLRDAFAVTGTAHLLAISGSNMTLVAAAVGVALRGRARPIVVAVGGAVAVAGYALLVGPSPSVVRAALMAAVASLGLALGRRGATANALGAAVAGMLLWDPRAISDVGFQLSVAATAGLIAGEAAVRRRLTGLPGPIAAGLSATVAASIPTIPIVAAAFGRVSLVSPLANVVAVPLFAPIMLFGAATATAGTMSPGAAGPLAMAAYASAAALRHVVELGAAVPYASLSVPSGPLTAAVVAAALLLAYLAAGAIARSHPRFPGIPRLRRPALGRRSAAVACASVALIVVGAGATAGSALGSPSGFRLHALDIGQGDAFLLESDGRYALIDGGPDPALVLRRLGEVLPPWHRRIDLIALTHEHADHGAGLLGVIDRYEIGAAIEPAGMGDVPLVRLWGEKLAAAHVPRHAVTEGVVVRIGRATLRVLAPGRDRKVDVPSLVIHASDGTSSVLFLGDAVDDALADLLLSPELLAARVLVPVHHGAATPHAPALVGAVRPEIALISVGAMNKYGHPAPSTLDALGRIPVYRTDRYGTVDVDLDDHPLAVRTAKAALPLDRGGSVPSAAAPR